MNFQREISPQTIGFCFDSWIVHFTIDTDEYYTVLRQFRRLAQGHCWSYENSLKQLLLNLHLWKNIFSSLLLAYWKYKPGFCFFPNKKKMSNLLHAGLKVFTILVYFTCVGIREYPGNFQNETVISKLFFKRSAQVKWEGRPFWSGQEA